jgi:hypothetical protein
MKSQAQVYAEWAWSSLSARGWRRATLSGKQLFHTGSALFVEEAACAFKSRWCDIVTRCQYYIFWVDWVFRTRVEDRIWSPLSPLIVLGTFRHRVSYV